MKRRQFVGGIAASPLLQFEDEGDGTDASSYEELDSRRFPTEVTVGWLVDRFIQVRDRNAPIVGHSVEITACVLEVIDSPEEHDVLRERHDWEALDHSEGGTLPDLFGGVSWPLEMSSSLEEDVFDQYDLVWLAGVHSDYYDRIDDSVSPDRQFYDVYEHAPFIFTLVPKRRSEPAGSVVGVRGTVMHTGHEDSDLSGVPDGGYLSVDSLSPIERLRTDDRDWQRGAEATFTGLQYYPEPRLTSSLTDVEYDDDQPRPKGGSLVTKRGVVDAAGRSTDGDGERHELSSESQNVLVGDALPVSWEDSESPGGDVANISLVVDTSGSMDQRDTNTESDDGRTLTRLEVAKRSLKELIDFVEDDHRVSVVEFDTQANLVEELTVIDDRTREDAKSRIGELRSNGNTAIGGGMQLGMESIVDEPGPKTMVLLSDGEENRRPSVDEVLPELRNRGIEVYTIGMGEAIDEAQLEHIADETGGDSAMAPDPADVKKLYHTFSSFSQLRPILQSDSETVDTGDVVTKSCTVDSSCEDVQFSLSYPGSEMVLTVVDPDGERVTERNASRHHVGDAHEVWTIEDPPAGEWEYEVEVVEVDAPQEASIQASARTPIDGDLFVSTDLYEETGFVRVQLKLTQDNARYTDADASLEVRPPRAREDDVEVIELVDDGSGPDDVADDGIYSAYFHPTTRGEHEFTAVIEGGEYEDLGREFSETVDVGSVVDEPIKPYQEAGTGGGGGSWFDDVGAPAVLGALALGAGWLYFRDSDDDGAAAETRPPRDEPPAATDAAADRPRDRGPTPRADEPSRRREREPAAVEPERRSESQRPPAVDDPDRSREPDRRSEPERTREPDRRQDGERVDEDRRDRHDGRSARESEE